MNSEPQLAEVRMVKDGVAAANETLRALPTSVAGHNKPEVKPVGAVANTGYNHR